MDGYIKHPGADGSGRDYEIKITSLLALRCALRKDVQEIWLGSNLDQVGNFDDVVLFKQSLDGTVTAYLLQLKHQDVPKNIKQGEFTSSAKGKDFQLWKYHEEYTKLKDRILIPQDNESLIVKDLRRANKIVFILYTNRGVNPCPLIEEYYDDNLRFLNTSVKNNVYKFKELSDYGSFLDDVLLFAEQSHLKDIERLMINEIKTVLGTDFLNNDDFNYIVDRFCAVVRLWANDKSVCQALTKTDALNQITDLLLHNFKIGLSKEYYECYSSPTKLIWNSLVAEKVTTVVDFSDEVVGFLKAYVGSELGDYRSKNVKTWSDTVKDAQKLLANSNIKVMDIRNNLTLLDVYKYLWFTDKVPLLLQVETTEDYKNIFRILKLSGYTKRVIIVAKCDLSFVVRAEKGRYFLNLKDVESHHLRDIVRVPIRLQGRGPILLCDVVDETMHQLVKTRDIISILSGTYTIGDSYQSLPDFFIERYMPKLLINQRVLSEMTHFFLIEGEFHARDKIGNTLRVRSRGEALQVLPSLRREHLVVHWLKYDQHLEWLQSFDNALYLQDYVYFLPNCKKSVNEISSNVNIISASPGMGKTVVLDYVTHTASTDKWVLRLNLAEFDERRIDSYVECSSCGELAARVFQKMKSQRNVIVLLDGLDEVSVSQQEVVLGFAKTLVEKGFTIWMTARPFLKASLERAFETFAMSLVPFTIDDQRNFLTKYFRQISDAPEHQQLLRDFVDELLVAAQRNLHDWDYEFTGIPLQTKLLADVFRDNCKESLDLGAVHFNRSFNLVFLYDEFAKRKLDIMTTKFGRTAIDMRVLFEQQQKLLALRVVFPSVYLQSLDVDKQLNDLFQNDDFKMQFMQREGLLMVESGVVKFVHRTFAEYLAAQWLSENPTKSDLMQLRFLNQYTFFFTLFDYILSKNNALHTAVINSMTSDALELIRTKPDLVNAVDACGRNVVHLIALYGFHHKAYKQYEKITEPLLTLLKNIHDVGKMAREQDKSLYTPLDYAVSNWSLAVGDYLSRYNTVINAEIDHYRKDAYFAHCAAHGYSSLFRLLLLYFSAREILYIRTTDADTVASQFFFSSNIGASEQKSILLLSKDFYNLPLKELFKYKHTSSDSEVPDYYYDLRFASSFGTEDNIKFLLEKGVDVNQADIDRNTSLHYACINGRLENVEVLLRHGAQVNLLNVNNNSPLHYSIRRNHDKISELLLRNGANPNFQNRNQFTTLHFALTCTNKKPLVELMIKCGADPNLQNNKLNTALHYAAQMGFTDILSELIKKGGEVNKINYNNESPLFSAVRHNHVDAALFLLSRGAFVNLRNKNKQTVLNVAAEKGLKELVIAFLDAGADVNSIDLDGDSPFNDSLVNGHLDVAKILWEGGADGNIRNNDGYCALHYVAGADSDLLPEMLKKVDVNVRTGTNDTALHLALSRGRVDNALELLRNGADVNVVNNDGNTPLHIAAFVGDAEIVALMLETCREPDRANNNKDTPLHVALKKRHLPCANLLIPTCDVNKLGTALHYAIKKCHVEVVQFLINNYVEIDSRDENGRTPLHVVLTDALHDSNPDIDGCLTIIKLLLNAGADVNAEDEFGKTALYYTSKLNSIFITVEVLNEISKQVSQILIENGADSSYSYFERTAAKRRKKHKCCIS